MRTAALIRATCVCGRARAQVEAIDLRIHELDSDRIDLDNLYTDADEQVRTRRPDEEESETDDSDGSSRSGTDYDEDEDEDY